MKTAATVIVVLALFSFIHKEHKNKAQPAVFSRPPITYSGTIQTGGPQTETAGPESATGQLQPEYTANDALAKQQIIKFAKTQYRSLAVSDEKLDEIAGKIVKYSTIYGIDYALAAALIARESRFNPNAVSSHGAKGLGQLIDSTSAALGVSNPYDIDQNLNGAFKYFRGLMDRWPNRADQADLALASYLLGPRGVEGGSLSESARSYISDVLSTRDRIKSM